MDNQQESQIVPEVSQEVMNAIQDALKGAQEARQYFSQLTMDLRAKKVTGIDLEYARGAWQYWMGVCTGITMTRPSVFQKLQLEELADSVQTSKGEIKAVQRGVRQVARRED